MMRRIGYQKPPILGERIEITLQFAGGQALTEQRL